MSGHRPRHERRPVVEDECTGAGTCRATLHVHGCFADLDGSHCDDPDDHDSSTARHQLVVDVAALVVGLVALLLVTAWLGLA